VPSNDLTPLSMACFVQKIFATKSRSRRKTEQIYMFFGSQYFGNNDQIVSAIYDLLFGKVRLSFVC